MKQEKLIWEVIPTHNYCGISQIILTRLHLEVKYDSKSCLLERTDSSAFNTHVGFGIGLFS